MADTVVTKIIEVDVKASAAANQHIKDIADQTKRIGDAAEKSSGSLGQLTSWVKGFIGFQIFEAIGEKVMGFASALQQASDQSRQLEERMKLVSHSTDDAKIAFTQIIDIAVRQGRELDGVAKLYERVTRSSEQLGVTQRGVALITEGMAASLRLAGAGTQEANAAMLQFSQAIASGKLGGDEFRSLMENDTVLMKAFADQLGVTMGQFRDMSKEGKLNAGTLRSAMLELGEDGKNVMQRMIEQAERLPKTFDQAVSGIKAATVDVVNAFQQMGDKSEGIFTHIVRSLTNELRHAAQLLRDQALISEEVAKQMEKQLAKPEQDVPFEAKRAMDIIDNRARAQEAFNRAENEMRVAQKAEANNPNFAGSLRFKGLADNIARARGELNAYTRLVSQLNQQDAGDIQGGGYTYKAAENPTPKVKKGKHPRTDEDVYETIRSQLEDEADLLQTKLAGREEWMAKADALYKKLTESKQKMSDAEEAAAKSFIYHQSEMNFQDKQELAFRDLMNKAVQASDERVMGKERERYSADLKRFTDAYNKEHLTKDPFEGIEAEIKRVREVMWNEDTSNEDVETLVKYIHALREKAAKQLLGEKDPMKDVAMQMKDSFASAFDTMLTNLLDFNKSVKDIFADMAISILQSFAKIKLSQEFQPLLEAGSKAAGNFFSGLFGAKDGAAFGPGGVRMFAMGGIVDQPTGFSYNGGRSAGQMGEAGTEAVMPLARDRTGRLGVAAAPVTVIVQNMGSNTRTRQTETENPDGSKTIKVVVEDAMEAAIGSGRLDSVATKSWGVSRKGN